MDAVTEDLIRADTDAEMTVLSPEEFAEQNLEGSDEVEHLRNSLREAVHDDNVRPKMQCLMMDSSFSMVTMQGEDSGIAWETTPSRCTTPWASETGNPTVELGSPVAVRPATPGSVPAGKIIFVMDEELMSRRKKTKEKKPERRILVESSENISGRPELVEVSQPNVKTEGEGEEEESNESPEDKEQRLFRLVSEGSEILNIIVPPKLATVDEEESKEMVDNLSYLEESLVPKANEDPHDYEILVSITEPAAARAEVMPLSCTGPRVMDPPGAPVARPPGMGAPGNVDYFEAFALIDAQAPGGPAVVAKGGAEQEAEGRTENQEAEEPATPKDNKAATTALENDKLDTISLEEITSDLLDEVFYAGTEDYVMKSLDKEDGVPGTPSRLPSKPSGSNLFGSQEEILTPIFLPDGPPKIIDPILLEEPKAMAFLYTDLYEEAIGNRMKEEDTESLTSEKSFHSRHSDREARGYLEKYVLIDETPAVEGELSDKEKCRKEGPRTLSDDLYDMSDMLSRHGMGEVPNSEEEITDFFRTSDNSSPCDIEPFSRKLEEEEPQSVTKRKDKPTKNVSIKVEKVAADPLSISSFEFLPDEPDWGGMDDHPAGLDEKDVGSHPGKELWKQGSAVQMPVAPPRRRTPSAPKACLDLTPLTPVEIIQEQEEAGGKEQREEEKETASPAETADEGDGEEPVPPSNNDAPSEEALVEVDAVNVQSVEDSKEVTVIDKEQATAEQKDTETVEEGATKETETKEVDMASSELVELEVQAENLADDSNVTPAEPATGRGRCIIL
ncbi:cardiomyopathy-associated protein 5 [Cheilinus undulatus]|uniref:cardiomyopathy-associated protein 5 n=1 Tax=Cheilinus undulatus TaxID=241271 RepID=UPI001BD31713|nr:cardiomyopathy-associated protein 5 [Cheilinus undulatus]